MQKIIGVKFSGSKTYNFDPLDKTYEIGDEVVVETANGQVVGVVSQTVKEINPSELEESLKPVLRLVNENDRAKQIEMKKKSKELMPSIDEKIKKLGLVMKLVDVEYTLDASKVIISFTADGRVDFRELLKELASMLKARIELRQIGAREEVKAIGGLGLCGMECCCTKFLNEQEHVSVKMAKIQNLSLSPTKINGLCGRLMCCLAYENQTYTEILSRMPKVGSQVKTVDGIGVVQYNDLLKERVTVKIAGKDDSFQINEYDLKDIEIKEKTKPNITHKEFPKKNQTPNN